MVKLIFVGGFLGAGKTTLLYEATQLLKNRNKKVGIITNDQAPDLADTSLLEHSEKNIAEVAGSCFCCDFKELQNAINKVGKNETDVIIAEPVGSCTDLSATIINPIKEMLKTEVSVSPLTVLADPKRLKDILEGGTSGLHPNAAYIFRKQLEESDIILLSKSDLYSPEEIKILIEKLKINFPECEIRNISSKTGEGIDDWLNSMLEREDAGNRILEIDYAKYAEGEAVLGWLNASVALSGNNIDWDIFAQDFMQKISTTLDKKNISIGHIKIMVENGDNYFSSNLTGKFETLTYRWSAGIGNEAEMIVNARAETSPEELKEIFIRTLETSTKNSIKAKIKRLRSISPGYPKPTYRFTE